MPLRLYRKRYVRKAVRRTPKYSKAAIVRSLRAPVERISHDTTTKVLRVSGSAYLTVTNGDALSGTNGTIPLIL